MSNWLADLNDRQLEAVETNDTSMLILAGAGTGKTKTVVSKIGHILDTNLARTGEIIALTFTNKAAKEMKDRLSSVQDISYIWIGTFHSICVRILRMYHESADLDKNFIIADQSESHQVIKSILKDKYQDVNVTTAYKEISSAISRLKENGISHDSNLIPDKKISDVPIADIYKEYQLRLKRSNLLDFDDIILMTTKMLQRNLSVKEELSNRFKYIFVDEYQDTSSGQNELIKAISTDSTIICCVGDEDQSIYSWRGANIDNILDFQKNLPSSKIITLNKNYRSTANIVDFAYSLIKQNIGRYEKDIRSTGDQGEKAKIVCAEDGRSEGNYIAQEITELQNKGVCLNDVSVLVRASFQNKALEEAFNSYGIPYRIVDGVKFFDRKEIKDIIAYLRFAFSHQDELSFQRIINTPKRGIGQKTIDNILNRCALAYKSPIVILKEMLEQKEFKPAQVEKIEDFVSKIESWSQEIEEEISPISKIVSDISYQTGYIDVLKEESKTDPSAEERILNIQSLVNDLNEFNSAAEFLEYMSLASQKDTEAGDNAVNIGTIHGAKGLEFDHVFCCGWEENVFPSAKSIEYNSDKMIEEERRLGYVAITRAKSGVSISFAQSRFSYGSWKSNPPSRFISELRHNAPTDSFENIYLEGVRDNAEQSKNNTYSSNRENSKYNWEKRKAQMYYGDQSKDSYSNRDKESYKKGGDSYYSQYKSRNTTSNSYKNVNKDTFRPLESIDNPVIPFKVGSKIQHSTFGIGTIEKLLGNYAEVVFDGTEGKRLIHRNFIKNIKD